VAAVAEADLIRSRRLIAARLAEACAVLLVLLIVIIVLVSMCRRRRFSWRVVRSNACR
jgi:hypothetical protein